jgi:hypothetical protein
MLTGVYLFSFEIILLNLYQDNLSNIDLLVLIINVCLEKQKVPVDRYLVEDRKRDEKERQMMKKHTVRDIRGSVKERDREERARKTDRERLREEDRIN